MREPSSEYPASRYERPNQPWTCGLADQGESCPAGPSAHGRCPAMAECAPIQNGDRWACNRSELRGGPCEAGPTPDGGCGRVLRCRPVRSLRGIRGRFVRASVFLTFGLVIIGLSTNARNGLIAPGPLARQHAQLMAPSGGEPNCAACHAAAERNIGGWMASLVSAGGGHASQSELCMKCHEKTIPMEYALAAHNVPESVLREITGRTLPRPLPTREGSSIACAACHREHQGAQADLAAMDNVACQSCHQRRYESFAADHADFGIWPYERRTRIAFNHASHRDKHFADKKQAFDCRSCHVEDATNRVQQLVNYESACAKCHDEKIATSVARGVPMFVLPSLDVSAMRTAGFDVGPWPKAADGDFDGRLPPAMKLLLAFDPAASQAIERLGPSFDFQDVNPDDREHLEACAAIASAIKKLMAEMRISPRETIRARLRQALGRSISDADADALLAGLSIDTLQNAANNWIGGPPATSDRNVPLQSGDGPPPQANAPSPQPSPRGRGSISRPIAFAPAGAWTFDDASLAVRYRPTGHADPVLATWLKVVAESAATGRESIATAMLTELLKPDAPGLCASCHSAETSGAGAIVVNWHAYDRTREPRGFTKFSHGPHILLPQLADCTHCHSVDTTAAVATGYSDLDPNRFVSDFAPISKRQCTECHTAKAAGDACQQCHNYHVDSSPLAPQEAVSSRGTR